MDADRACAVIAERQFGLLSRAQVLQTGMKRAAIGRRLNSGRWQVVFPKVYAIAGAPLNQHALLMGAVLWAGPGSAVSHRAAAGLWSLWRFAGFKLEITHPGRTHCPPGIKLFRHANLPEHHTVDLQGLRVTTCSRTLMDIGGLMQQWQLNRCVHLALQRRDVTLDELRRLLAEEGRRGRRGTAATRLEVAIRAGLGRPAGSRLADRFLQFLVRSGFERPVAEFRIFGPDGFVADVDFAYPALKIAFEVDHYFTHGDRMAFERDRERDRVLAGLGWIVIRVTEHSMSQKQKLRAQIAEILPTHPPTS